MKPFIVIALVAVALAGMMLIPSPASAGYANIGSTNSASWDYTQVKQMQSIPDPFGAPTVLILNRTGLYIQGVNDQPLLGGSWDSLKVAWVEYEGPQDSHVPSGYIPAGSAIYPDFNAPLAYSKYGVPTTNYIFAVLWNSQNYTASLVTITTVFSYDYTYYQFYYDVRYLSEIGPRVGSAPDIAIVDNSIDYGTIKSDGTVDYAPYDILIAVPYYQWNAIGGTLYAGLDRYSHDNSTWTFSENSPFGSAWGGITMLDISAYGNTVWVTCGRTGSNLLGETFSTDGGETFPTRTTTNVVLWSSVGAYNLLDTGVNSLGNMIYFCTLSTGATRLVETNQTYSAQWAITPDGSMSNRIWFGLNLFLDASGAIWISYLGGSFTETQSTWTILKVYQHTIHSYPDEVTGGAYAFEQSSVQLTPAQANFGTTVYAANYLAEDTNIHWSWEYPEIWLNNGKYHDYYRYNLMAPIDYVSVWTSGGTGFENPTVVDKVGGTAQWFEQIFGAGIGAIMYLIILLLPGMLLNIYLPGWGMAIGNLLMGVLLYIAGQLPLWFLFVILMLTGVYVYGHRNMSEGGIE